MSLDENLYCTTSPEPSHVTRFLYHQTFLYINPSLAVNVLMNHIHCKTWTVPSSRSSSFFYSPSWKPQQAANHSLGQDLWITSSNKNQSEQLSMRTYVYLCLCFCNFCSYGTLQHPARVLTTMWNADTAEWQMSVCWQQV